MINIAVCKNRKDKIYTNEEIDFETLLGRLQASMTMHLDTAVDVETVAVQIKKFQIGADLTILLVVLIDTAAAGEQIGNCHQGYDGQGMVFIDDIHGGDDVADQFTLFDGGHP